jgi:hypothetical protein
MRHKVKNQARAAYGDVDYNETDRGMTTEAVEESI